MSVVTLTTVGFGDVTPSTATGTALGLVWMLLGVSAMGNFAGAAGQCRGGVTFLSACG